MGPRLLLINPRFEESFWSFRWALRELLPEKRAVNPPLGLATLAALCPPHWQVEIVDENIEPVPLRPDADLVGVCGMGVQFKRQAELISHYRRLGYRVVAGGSYASLCPEAYATLADSVVAGEAEYIWPAFCRDFERGETRPLYRETGTVALADSPTPRFDLLKLDKYTTATLQFSRGCPFRCEFCDIIVMFGRKPRYKTLAQVDAELDALRAQGVCNVFFVDDNLIGHKAAAKELLRHLRTYQSRHGYEFRFGTEASLNMAQDRELLQLFRDANFTWVFIGIESPDAATLRNTAKTQNLHEDTLTAVRRIYSYGIDILAGFIIGFDNDTPATFDLQFRFIRDSGIQAAMIGLLTALPKTPLHERLVREGRLLAEADHTDNTRVGTNVIPKNMSYHDMVHGYIGLYRRLLSNRLIAERLRNKLRFMRNPVYHGEYSGRDQLRIVARLITRGVLSGGPSRAYHFLRSLPWLAPRKLPLAVVDWIAALSMRDYVERRFLRPAPDDNAVLARWYGSATRAVRRYLQDGRASIELRLPKAATPHLYVQFAGGLDRAFFARCAHRLETALRRTGARVTLVIDEIERPQLPHLERLLERLARHGDRIAIHVSERLRDVVIIDSSIFHLLLDRSPWPALPER
ncbi:MAG: radical SAM protein [Betaproteobacteria bacterium]